MIVLDERFELFTTNEVFVILTILTIFLAAFFALIIWAFGKIKIRNTIEIRYLPVFIISFLVGEVGLFFVFASKDISSGAEAIIYIVGLIAGLFWGVVYCKSHPKKIAD